MTEFALDPSTATVAQGGSIEAVNGGNVAHNLAVTDTDLKTPDINGGESASLDISSLAPGSYEILCLIAGHADAGMKGTLEVVTGAGGVAAPAAGGDDAAADHSGHDAKAYPKMTEDMLATMTDFPRTEARRVGKGGVSTCKSW